MMRSYLVLLILSFGLLTEAHPYGGDEGSRWRVKQQQQQQQTEVVPMEPEYGNEKESGGKDITSVTSYGVDKKVDAANEIETHPGQGETIKDIDIGYVSGSDQGKPDLDYVPSGTVDKLGPDFPGLPKDSGLDSGYGVDKTIPHEGADPDYVPDKDIPYEGTGSDYVPDKPYEGSGSDYVPDKDIPYGGTGSDYVPDKPNEGTGSDYVPDKPYEGTGSDYVPDKDIPYGGAGSEYVPDKPNEGTGSDYVPDKPYEGTGSDYVPDKDIPYGGTGSDYVPDKPNEGTGSDYVPDKPYEGTGSDYVPDKDIPYGGTGSDYAPDKPNEGTGSDYVTDKEIPYGGTGSDYVPDKPFEGTGSDFVPDKDISHGGTGSDYVPDKPYERADSDYVPDKTNPDYDINSSYLPPKEISPEGKGNDYVPDKVIPLEGAGSDYVPKDTLPNYVPDQGIEELEEEIITSYEPGYKGSHKGSVHEESYGKGSDHYKPEVPEETWYEKLKRKWNKVGESAKEVAHSVGRTFDTAVAGIEGHFNTLWHKFKKVLNNFGYEIQRGARYVFTVISTSVEKVKASTLIEKLEQRLEQGNEIVDEFFQKVGQKMTHWAQQHNHENIDEGFFLETQQSKENNFLDIFQDQEIYKQVEKMVTGGIITQDEADLINQIKQTKVEETLDSSYIVPDKHDSSGSYGNIEGSIDQFDASGTSYGAEGKVDHAAYDNQDAKPHHTTKKELEGHAVEEHGTGYGGDDFKAINFPAKGVKG